MRPIEYRVLDYWFDDAYFTCEGCGHMIPPATAVALDRYFCSKTCATCWGMKQ